MGLLFHVVMGIVVGVTVMAGWHCMMKYRSSKRASKAIDINLLASLATREDLEKFLGHTVSKESERISFPVFERAKWINKELSKLWPYVADAAEMTIWNSVEPLLEKYHPAGISSLEFSKLTLGTVAPKIRGIRVESTKPDQITMDIDVKWGGNPSIILAVTAANVASIPIQLKDFKVFTVIRVIFQLADEIPCISAVAISLLSEPKPVITFKLKLVGGSLTAFPGISEMINYTIDTMVADTLEWPSRIVIPIGSIPVDTSDLECKPKGRLTVTIVNGNGVKTQEFVGKSELCAALYIRAHSKVKTKVVQYSRNPVWNGTYELIVEDKETQSLVLEVLELEQETGQEKQKGIAKLPLLGLEPEIPNEIDLRLLPALDMTRVKDENDRGRITVKVLYHVFSKEEQDIAIEAERKKLDERQRRKEAAGVVERIVGVLEGVAQWVGSDPGARAKIARFGLGVVASGLNKADRFVADVKSRFG